MRKDHLHRRSKDAEGTNDGEVENGDPLSGSADPFDALLNSKSEEPSTSRANGKRAPSPIADSDTENDNETKNDEEKSEVNGDSTAESSADNGGNEEDGYEVSFRVMVSFWIANN